MAESLLEKLREEFLQEARSAPKLFKDLAKVEQYIAESYKTRALIELLQNADDAGATLFGLHSFGSGFVVGNNGRPFTVHDVEALCRSGSSNKRRGGNTIGYRGIGFKSVVNLARRICVFSGDFTFYFQKQKTQQILQNDSDVPLIRVPHPLEGVEDTPAVVEVREIKNKYGYETLFVFDALDERISLDDLSAFDRSSLLFLNHLKSVHLDFQHIQRNVHLEIIRQNEQNIVKLTESNESDEWEVLSSKSDPVVRVAFKKFQDCIVPASLEQSVVHCFIPTVEFAGAYIKINGDYSTDPSRTNIDMDELSRASFGEAVDLITNSIAAILNGDMVKKGFFTPFINVKPQEVSRFKSLLFKSLEENLGRMAVKMGHAEPVNFSSFRLKPEWLSYEEYEKLCCHGIASISKELLLTYPELFSFLEALHVRTLSLEEVLQRFNVTEVTPIGSAQICSKIVKQYRYDLDSAKIAELKSLNMFPIGNSFVPAGQVKTSQELKSEFWSYLQSHTDPADAKMVLKKLGIEVIKEANETNASDTNAAKPSAFSQQQKELSQKGFKVEPVIKKWRSAEQNAAEYLRSLQSVLNVADVSQANLGYDLEVFLSDRRRLYIEIKSVSSFSEPFQITNNEYSSAHSYGMNYYIALVVNGDPFQIKLICDPINSLAFEKRCERWSWYCEQYASALRDVIQSLFRE
jgi:hypothetical protein